MLMKRPKRERISICLVINRFKRHNRYLLVMFKTRSIPQMITILVITDLFQIIMLNLSRQFWQKRILSDSTQTIRIKLGMRNSNYISDGAKDRRNHFIDLVNPKMFQTHSIKFRLTVYNILSSSSIQHNQINHYSYSMRKSHPLTPTHTSNRY